MSDNQDRINQLPDKLEILLKRHDELSREINQLRMEVDDLKSSGIKDTPTTDANIENSHNRITVADQGHHPHTKNDTRLPTIKLDIEKFIGENLINKIGIAITIIGVAIGAKYSIEHDLVTPLMRIALGYLMAFGLLGFGFLLKKNYKNYSAVLVSGAMAIMYFITYSGYNFYGLIPQVHAFILMVIFTVFTVLTAINYNRQVIALIGLVGAYAVPFLLSEGSGKVAMLFIYMAIINVGILVIAFRKYWKLLYYSSFGLTWVMYFVWYISAYQADEYFRLALIFLSVFFASFYLMFLAYKLLQKETFEINDIILLLVNSFIFYGIGYALFHSHETGAQFVGLFTLGNAIIHLLASAVVYHQKLADRNLFYLVSGLVLVFIAIAIPVQLDGNWVTLLWAGEAALLFRIGRTKNTPFYEKLSYLLMFLAFFSIIHDWTTVYDGYSPGKRETRITPLLNIHFLTSFLCIIAFGFINGLKHSKKYASIYVSQNQLWKMVSFSVPAMLFFILYYAFRIEIATYWDQLYRDYSAAGDQNLAGDISRLKIIWIINYSLLFAAILSFVNTRMLKNEQLGLINLGLNALAIVVFLVQGLYVLSELQGSYLENTFNTGIRYVSLTFVAITLVACYRYVRQDFMKRDLGMAFHFLYHTAVLWIASSELIYWMNFAEFTQSYKLGLSLLWGIYSLLLIAIGIWKRQKYLRIGAILLFAVTLIKLFIYDISHLDTIAKTVVFVSLGILLLIISFLYNKYKHIISAEING